MDYFFADGPSNAEAATVPAASVLGFTRSNTGSEAYEVCWASARVSILPESTMGCVNRLGVGQCLQHETAVVLVFVEQHAV